MSANLTSDDWGELMRYAKAEALQRGWDAMTWEDFPLLSEDEWNDLESAMDEVTDVTWNWKGSENEGAYQAMAEKVGL